MTQPLLAVTCPQCGGPERYDLANQRYRCAHCGAEADPAQAAATLAAWRDHQLGQLRRQAPEQARQLNCTSCGAQLVATTDSQIHQCRFCGAPLVAAEFISSPHFPGAVVPFSVLSDQARELAEAWLRSHRRLHHADELAENLHQLRGAYLPYQVVKGPVEIVASRQNGSHHFPGVVMLHGKVVCAADNVHNELLDAIEPFDLDALQPFAFGHLGDFPAKTQDVSPAELRARADDEITDDLHPRLSRALHTPYVDVDADPSQTMQLPVLLPVYVMRAGDAELAVNGQTGAVGYRDRRVRKDVSWIVEPIVMTVLVFLVAAGLVGYAKLKQAAGLGELLAAFGRAAVDELTLSATVLSAILFFVVFSEYRGRRVFRRIIRAGSASRTSRATAGHGLDELAFYDQTGGRPQHVQIGFYTAGRVLASTAVLVGWILLPALPAFIVWLLGSRGPVSPASVWASGGPVVWLCLAVPFTIIGWIVMVRGRIFDAPLVRPVAGGAWRPPAGRQRFKPGELVRAIWELPPARWLTIAVVVLAVICGAVMVAA